MWQARSQTMGLPPKASRARRGKGFTARATARPPSSTSSSTNPQAVSLSIPGAKPPGRPLRMPPLRLELVGTRPPQKPWIREPNLLRMRRLRRRMTTTCTFACRGRRWRQWIPGAPGRCSSTFPALHSVPVQLPAPTTQQWLRDSSTMSYTHVSVLQPGGSGDTNVGMVDT